MKEFNIQLFGKWILTGEHSVLKGAPAIALPQTEVYLKFHFLPSGNGFHVIPESSSESIQKLCKLAYSNFQFIPPSGILTIESTIPMGAGFGSSAALCVAFSQWVLEYLTSHQTSNLKKVNFDFVQFAKELENIFHGKSSGLDIQVIAANSPITFQKEGGFKKLELKKLPKFRFHDSGIRANTKDCILRVEAFQANFPEISKKVDQDMTHASHLAHLGLLEYESNPTESLMKLKKAMDLAKECFYSWELVPGTVKQMEEELLQKGAISTKLTGSGGGGFLVSLWNE